MGAFKRLIQWIEGTEDKKRLRYKLISCLWGAFKRLILWIEGTEVKKDLVIN